MKSPMRSEIVTRDLEFLDLLLNSGKNREVYNIFGKKFVVEEVAKDRAGGVAVLVEVNEVEDREESWTGTGLPPVGTVCEALISGGWYRGTVIGHCVPPRESFAAFQGDGLSDLIFGSSEYFRPIRAPEQIAAEEREKAVDEMMAVHEPWIATRRFCEKLYDAGYRRQEPKE